ncbi:hypothetical protein [Methylobacterium sp. J-068]|nr:hypothetical protein [Methylobacterium sp. J-068]MCJ2033153.1 hypothetical protein [Methylobacterium sp. J-068]
MLVRVIGERAILGLLTDHAGVTVDELLEYHVQHDEADLITCGRGEA